MTQNQYSHHYTLTAGESDAEGRMPLTLVTERVIEVATEHANALGIGYDALIVKNIGWVLSRLSVEMLRYPAINDSYTLTTWIESYNRHFSERNFVMTDPAGNVYGHMRTVWVAMDFATRTVADLSAALRVPFPLADVACPIAKTPRIPRLPDVCSTESYTFRYRDLDFNRHVNTVRYLDLILNHWPLEHFDMMVPARFDIMFHHECHFGETVQLRVADGPESCPGDLCEIVKTDGTRAVAARIFWKI
ncbi:MAG: thioesterase [Muribaculaceae bacterium]|nr:thioesterase [Muribaculaceae bacterium]